MWVDKQLLRQTAQKAALAKEVLTLSPVDVLDLLDAVDAAEMAQEIAEAEANDLQMELHDVRCDLDEAQDENIELRSGTLSLVGGKAQA